MCHPTPDVFPAVPPPAAAQAEVDAAHLAVRPGLGRHVHRAERRRLAGAAQGVPKFSLLHNILTVRTLGMGRHVTRAERRWLAGAAQGELATMYLCQLALCIANRDWRKSTADSSTIFFLFVRRTDVVQGGMLLICCSGCSTDCNSWARSLALTNEAGFRTAVADGLDALWDARRACAGGRRCCGARSWRLTLHGAPLDGESRRLGSSLRPPLRLA